MPLEVDDRLRELHFGDWEGQLWADIENNDPETFHRWMETWKNDAPPGGETLLELEDRVRQWCSELDPCQSPLVVTHAGTIRALRVIAGTHTWDEAIAERVPHLVPERFEMGLWTDN